MEEEKKKVEIEDVIPTNEVKETNSKPNVPGSGNKGLIICLITIIILLAAGLIYVLFFNKPKDNKVDETPVQETEKEQEEKETTEEEKTSTETKEEKQEETKQYELTVYKYKDGGSLSNDNELDNYLEKAFTIKVDNKNAKVIATNYKSTDMVLYDDNGLYIYNDKTKSKDKLTLENNYESYEFFVSEDGTKATGICYSTKAGKFGYYNIAKKIKMYDGKYTYFIEQLNDHYLSTNDGNTAYLLSSDSESTKLSYKYGEIPYGYTSYGKNGDYIFGLGETTEDIGIRRLYSNNLQMFYETTDLLWENDISFYNNYLYLVKDKKILKYNTKGSLVSTSSEYENIQLLINDYVVCIKDNNLVLENINNTSESKTLVKWNNDWDIDGYDSGYYTREALDRLGEKNKKAGLYVVVDYGYNDKGAIKDSKGNYGIEYCYTTDKQIVEYGIKQEKGGRAKPVLYLYPEKETDVTVTFAHPEYLTTTYPKYINSWKVKVSPNGDMYDSNGKYYYALYWDETRYSEVDFKEGFYVDGRNAIKFLEEKLTIIGLSAKERNEFIMYWLPIMENNGKNLVYFELTKERELGNKLIINPKPDSLLRVSIHIKKVNQKVNIKEEKLETFKRVGFTAVEWGGMVY